MTTNVRANALLVEVIKPSTELVKVSFSSNKTGSFTAGLVKSLDVRPNDKRLLLSIVGSNVERGVSRSSTTELHGHFR
jgi:hypothetical protein